MDIIARAERAGQAYEDRLLNEYLSEGEYDTCPECEEETLEVTGKRERRGWWSKSECHNEECGYISEDCDVYDDY